MRSSHAQRVGLGARRARARPYGSGLAVVAVNAPGDVHAPPPILTLTLARIAYLSELFVAPEFNWIERVPIWLERRRLERDARRVWAKVDARVGRYSDA